MIQTKIVLNLPLININKFKIKSLSLFMKWESLYKVLQPFKAILKQSHVLLSIQKV